MSSLARALVNQATTIEHTFVVDETPTDSSTTVTYAVVDANGTAVTSGNASLAGAGSGRYTFVLPAQAALKSGTVSWAATIGGNATTETTFFDVAGGRFFTLKEGRDSDDSLSSSERYPTADLKAKRTEVEDECEAICDRAFVPRYLRMLLDGSGTSQLVLRHPDPERSIADIRTIRRISVAPDIDESFVDYTAGELAGVSWSVDGVLTRTDGSVFTYARRNVIVEIEYGLNRPPTDLLPGCFTRFRSRLNLNKSGIPDRATSYTMGEFGTYRLSMPDTYSTGIPDVDAVYSRYSRRVNGTGSNAKRVPASRTLTYDSQFGSLFHRKVIR